MKIYTYIILSLLFIATLLSCEKDVLLNLRSIEPRLVIDAFMQENHPCTVFLTETQDYYDNDYPIPVESAIIILSDNEGNVEELKETSSGIYQSHTIIGMPEKTYTLKVTTGGETYVATSTMPHTVEVESLYIYNIPIGKEDWYSPCLVFDDPKGIDNYYMATLYINGRRLRSPYLFDDEYKDGMRVENILFYAGDNNKDEDLKKGDLVKVEMRTITQSAYNYFVSMNSIASGGGTNPTTNFSGDVLGCFNIYGFSTIDTIVEDNNIYTKQAK
ncbi:MAG: DUF4249 domain-containing protein [Dysgonomonas sp.]